MVKKCSLCKKEIDNKDKIYTFAIGDVYTPKQNRIYYGRFCASCFSKLSLEEMDK